MTADRMRLRRALTGGLVLGGTVAVVLVGRLALAGRTPPPRAVDPVNVIHTASGPGAIVPSVDGPGAQTVVGRLIDRGTGLAVRDAGVVILELGRRSISLPDGRFRFDGVQPGAYTLVLGPAEGYVPRSLDIKVRPAGADIGILGLVPAGPPTLLTAAEGGAITACADTRLQLPAGALPEDQAITMACLTGEDELPAPPPAGRLPLAAIDLGPYTIGLIKAGQVEIALPSQPRYSAGVSLDLLRLDLDRLIWRPAGSLIVAADGRSAGGEILALGDYLAAAPPFGAFAGDGASAGPAILRLGTSVSADGLPTERVAPQTSVVYLDVAYRGLEDSPLRVRTLDAANRVSFESTERFSGDGSRRLAMTAEGGVWPVGDYVTSVYLGEPPQIQSLSWMVSEAAARPTLPAAWVSELGGASVAALPQAPPSAPGMPGCVAPAGWWAYTVQPGDTLGALAMRTGSTVAALQAANCLAGDGIQDGALLYVPTIVYKRKPPIAPSWPLPPKPATPVRGGGGSGVDRPPAATPSWPVQPYIKPTRPPDPTLAPRPTDPPLLWVAPPLPQDAPPPARPRGDVPPEPVQGAGSWKEPRGPDPTLAPRPGSP